jgi:hypothetical protein
MDADNQFNQCEQEILTTCATTMRVSSYNVTIGTGIDKDELGINIGSTVTTYLLTTHYNRQRHRPMQHKAHGKTTNQGRHTSAFQEGIPTTRGEVTNAASKTQAKKIHEHGKDHAGDE